MKRTCKCLFIFIFFISSFLILDNIKADYEATVINPDGAKCSLRSDSTGYCFYKDSSFSSVTTGVLWLDTNDKVTVIPGQDIPSPNTTLCPDKYVYAKFKSLKYGERYGYYCNYYLKSGSLLTDELKTKFTNAGFPESYFEDLAILQTAHPNWTFVALDTKLDFKTAVNNENSLGRSLIQVTGSTNNQGYLNTWSGSYNYYTDTFKSFDGSNWYAANYDTIAYYMDPRNFLKDMHVFQFERLSYDNSISETNYKNSINAIFKNDYLKNYTNDFYNAGKDANVKVNPIYLASLSYQEVRNGSTPGTAIDGKYNGMYNFYNIGASSSTNPVYNGLNFASKTDIDSMRPWDTPYKAIAGGAKWIAKNYISIGQDTIYFKKWDVVANINSASGNNYVHQYQTNIQAASSEAKTTYSSYSSSGILNTEFVFYIPVYNNMPSSTSLPREGNPNNYLSSLVIEGANVPDFDGAIETYNYYLNMNKSKITINASAVNSNAKISGIGTFDVNQNCTKTITVTAQNGDVKKYNINIILTGEHPGDSVDVTTTLNNAGIKNGNKYITGLKVESDIKAIKEKIINVNNSATVILKDRNDKEKISGKVATGDKILVTVGSETKTYEIVIYGDVNGDGIITASDYARVKNTFLKKSSLSGAFKEAADANKSGDITASDYARIKNTFLGKSSISQ